MRTIFLFLFLLINVSVTAQQILPEVERAKVVDEIMEERFNVLLPALMDKTGIDMWIVISREYNEDPVIKTMLPATWLNARRRTILMFYRNKSKNSIEKLAVARYNVGESITSAWDKEKEPDQWKRLMQLIEEKLLKVELSTWEVRSTEDHTLEDNRETEDELGEEPTEEIAFNYSEIKAKLLQAASVVFVQYN